MKIEPYSKTWLAVKKLCDDQIKVSTERAIRKDFAPIPTEYERGRIAALTEVLNLGNDLT